MPYSPPYDHSMKMPHLSHGRMSVQPLYQQEDYIGDEQLWLGSANSFIDRGQKESYFAFSWQQQQEYSQQFGHEAKQSLYSSNPIQTSHFMSEPSMDAVASFPLATGHRMVSPAPSQELSTPTSSNARSPATDPEWYPDSYSTPNILDDLVLPWLDEEFGTVCARQPEMSLFPESIGHPCVNMSQVQGFIDPQDCAEPQEDSFAPDERYLDIEQVECSIEVEPRSLTGGKLRASGRPSFASNEGLETAKDMCYGQEQDQLQADTDMDIDNEDEDEIHEDEASDTDYSPTSTRPQRRRTTNSSKSLSSSSARRRRARKSKGLRSTKSSKVQSANTCRNCKVIFKDTTTLQRHVESSHPRAFTCVFNFAGCGSTFASKNEWKRHVSTQHLNFHSWICDLDTCGKIHNDPSSPKSSGSGPSSRGTTFNRKDLFTQHLRRMHIGRKHQNKQKPADMEERIKELQNICRQVNRHGPKTLKCPVVECGATFGGNKCWDDRMEHVAKHLEKSTGTRGSSSVKHDNDGLLVSWALKEGIIEHVDGVYKLIPIAAWLDGLDQDADGEDEV